MGCSVSSNAGEAEGTLLGSPVGITDGERLGLCVDEEEVGACAGRRLDMLRKTVVLAIDCLPFLIKFESEDTLQDVSLYWGLFLPWEASGLRRHQAFIYIAPWLESEMWL